MYMLFLNYLSFLNRMYLKDKKKFYIKNSMVFVLCFVLSIFLDTFVLRNLLFDCVRVIFALGLGVSLFEMTFPFVLYGKGNKLEIFRRSLSYRQRRNLGILAFALSFVLSFLVIHSLKEVYTIFTGILLYFWIWILVFLKPTYEEVKDYDSNAVDSREFFVREEEE